MTETWKKLAQFDEVATTFLALSDTPAGYVGALKYYRVNAATNAVEEGLAAAVASGLATLDAGSLCAQDPKVHKDLHDPEDGSDPLDAAAPAELVGVQASGEGSAHELARADHAHQIQHSIADNHIVTMDDAGPAQSTEVAVFTASGLAGETPATLAARMALDDIGAPDADVDLGSQKITGLATPAAADDAATKGYVDGVATGLDLKESCRVATIEALPACTPAGSGVDKTLTADANGVLTVDGVEVALNDRILVKDQVSGDDNGIYKCTTAGEAEVLFVLTRATDFDEDAEVTAGAYTFIEEGTTLADQGWVLTTNDPITVDTTTLVFGQFSSAGGTPAHKDTHDPEDGSDALDCAVAGEIVGVGAAAEGNAHELARANHTHQIQHSIADNHIVTIDGADIADDEIARFTASGLESRTPAEVAATMARDDIGNPDAAVGFNGQQAEDLVVHTVANAAARPGPVVGKVCYQQDDDHLYVCTVAA